MRAAFLALLFLISASAFAVCPTLMSFAPREYTVRTLDVHDVDGDGNLDLLGMNAIAYGRADGTFEPAVSLGLADLQYAYRALDMDGDGRDDILFFNYSFSSPSYRYHFSVLPNNGNLAFGAPVPVLSYVDGATFGDPFSIQGGRVFDADGDGKADIVGFKDRLIVQRGDGNGGFLGSYEFGPATPSPWSIEYADVNGDQKTDLIATYRDETVSVYLGPFRDTTTPAAELPHPYAQAATGADFDGNGFYDLAVVDYGRTTIYLNDGHGNFNVSQVISMTDFDTRIAAADFNHDGVLDLVVPDSYIASGIAFGNGNGTFRLTPTLRAIGEGSQSQIVTSGDFDGDGVDELISASSEGLFAGRQAGPYTYDFEKLPLAAPIVLPYINRKIAIGDVDQDSTPELVVADGTSIDVFSRKNGRWIALGPYPTGSAVAGVAVIEHRIAFINGNGYLNIMALDGNPSIVAPILPLGNYSHILRAADLDRDGREDLVIGAAGLIYAVYGRGDGLFDPPLQIYTAAALDIVTGDFNGDRNADIAFTTEGLVFLLNGNGNRTFTAIPDAIRRETTSLTARDVDGDGITDLAVNDDQHYRYYGVPVAYLPLFYGLSLYRGMSNGLVQAGSWFAAASRNSLPVFARLRRGALPALLSARDEPGVAAVVEFSCSTRRQTVRH